MIYIFIILAIAMLILVTKEIKNKPNNEKFAINDALLNHDELMKHAIVAAKNHVVSKKRGKYNFLFARLHENYKFILSVYKKLNENARSQISLCPASEWLLDNFYIIEEQYKDLKLNIVGDYYEDLKILDKGPLKGYPRIFAISLELISHTDGRVDKDQFIEFIDAYQSVNLLTMAELWSLSSMIKISTMEKIRYVCEKIQSTQSEWEKIDQQKKLPTDEFLHTVYQDIHNMKELNISYLEHIMNTLKKEEPNSEGIVEKIATKLIEFDTSIESIINLEHQEQAGLQITMGNCITSLRLVNALNWEKIFEQVSMVEKILECDPSGTYRDQDFETRDYYRHQIEVLSKKLKTSETKIARQAIECSKTAQSCESSSSHESHIGFYIIGNGRSRLLSALKNKPERHRSNKLRTTIYILSMLLLTTIFTCLFFVLTFDNLNSVNFFLVLFLLLIFWIPTSEIVITTSNRIITKCTNPTFLPKLEFKNSIPKEATTIVIVPTLIPSKKRALELLDQLEVTYLANYEDNLYFALVGDFKDADTKVLPEDHQIIEAALVKIKELNKKYAKEDDKFFFFMRERTYLPIEKKWMGTERKRGAIVEFNNLIKGSTQTSYNIVSGNLTPLKDAKYILTLDADSILPIGNAKKLVGTISHPINRAVFNKHLGIVTSGYGLIQPRIGINITSSNKSIFSRIFAGRGGVDSYTNAISDVYQDLFGEGIFTGKGIYDLDIFVKALNDSIPDNAILSHDLLEGSYLRVGLATDIEIIDSYPEKYNSFIMRLHRWVRGDWQLIKWLFPRIKNKNNNIVQNPISSLSKWKIFDNLRKSLVSTSLMLIFVTSIIFIHKNILFWIGYALITIFLPLIFGFFEYFKLPDYNHKEKLNGNLIYGLKGIFYETFLIFVFLPYHSYTMINAIVKSLYRVFISNRNMLEWVTAADVEKNIKNDITSYIKSMYPPIITLYLLFILAVVFKPGFIVLPFILILFWSSSPFVAYYISKTNMKEKSKIDYDNKILLRRISRKTWLFYQIFSGEEDNYLPPDNYQISPIKRIAHRTSPTNIGLLMISTLAAKDMGYINSSELVDRLCKILDSIDKLDKWNGHLYNWYDTKTLSTLTPKYISTVDSGNFIGYLLSIRAGLEEILVNPIVTVSQAEGLNDTILLFDKTATTQASINKLICDNANHFDMYQWYKFLNELKDSYKNATSLNDTHNTDALVQNAIDPINCKLSDSKSDLPIDPNHVILHEIDSFLDDLNKLLPIIKIEDSTIMIITKSKFKFSFNELTQEIFANPSPIHIHNAYIKFSTELRKFILANSNNKYINTFKEMLTIIETADQHLVKLIDLTTETINRVSSLITSTSFAELYDSSIGLFSIGYNLENNKLTNSYYDLLASEARITSYLAIARREVPVTHWFKLGRSLALVEGYKSLVSWTGTMFEYFMPPLIMDVYENTLLDETYKTVLKAQINYGKKRNVPWGTSESGFHTFDLMLNYQYKAFGVPELGLKRGLVNDMVVSPYSTILGLPFSPDECIDNLKLLISSGLEGELGLFEAVDFTPERIPLNQNKAIVQSFMAHHQGMIMVALNNYLNDNIMVKRFHSCALIKAAEFLLQERIPLRLLITKEHKEVISPLEKNIYSSPTIIRKYISMDTTLPECHVLSNSSYVLLLTSKGQSYSRKDDVFLTRWREEISSSSHGFFIFFNDINTNKTWSATYEPLCDNKNIYETRFSLDKAEYFRRNDDFETHMEICVSPEDNCEIRRITLTNNSTQDMIIDCTSYSEIVLSNLMSDIAHPCFNSLFIRTELLSEFHGLIASKRSRETGQKSLFSFHSVVSNKEEIGPLEYETDRYKFIGRGHTIKSSLALDHPLSNTVGAVLDPIFSIRKKIKVEAGKSEKITFLLGITDTRETSVELMKKYNEYSNIERAFELSYIRNQMSSKYMNLMNSEIELFDNIISHILYLSPTKKKFEKYNIENKRGQTSLWSHGISGDLPIILLTINNVDDIDTVKTIVKAHEYWRIKGIKVDLIILNEDENSYIEPLQNMIRDIVLSSNSRDVLNSNGGIFIKSSKSIHVEDSILFYSVARIVIKAALGNIKNQIQFTEPSDSYPLLSKFENVVTQISNTNIDEPVDLKFFNEFGGFDPNTNEYVIKLKDHTCTPTPWINVIANKNFGFLETESGSGYTWSLNSRENKLTNWSNDPVIDPPSEIIYIRNDLTGEIWSITPLPIRENENYTITHGMGYSSFKHSSHGIDQELKVFVPVTDEKIKISFIELINKNSVSQELSIYYFVKPVLGPSNQLTQTHIVTKILEGTEILTAQNPYSSEFADCILFTDASLKKHSYTGDQNEFIGNCGCISSPSALKRTNLSGKLGAGFYPCCAFQSKVILLPNQTLEFSLLLGEGKTQEEIVSLADKYRNLTECKNALTQVKQFWEKMLGAVQIHTPDSSMDIMMNSWLLYQTIVCRLWARSAFYQSGGAYGFRDQLQDILSVIYTMPDAAKDQILLHCAHQFTEGDVQHWWHPYTNNKGIRTRFSDDLLWLPYAVAEYVKLTGDSEILLAEVPFLEDELLKENEDERYGIPRVSTKTATVYEHCILAIEKALRFGENGIPLMGSGDWNDGMNTVGNKGKGESVWMGWFLCTVLSNFSAVCNKNSDFNRVKEYQKIAKEIAENIEENAWDGKWYRRAYFDDGTPLGSSMNKECSIDSLSQSWAVISEYGDPARSKLAMESLENYLIKRDAGLILLFTPPFDNAELNPGYIKGYVPGVRENGGQYTHAATWVIYAFAKMGYGDKAYECFKLINPITHTMTQLDCARYKVEPYVLAADVYNVDIHNGRGGWTWYTGSSSWLYKIGLEKILGFQKTENELTINPCIPKNWPQFSITYNINNTTFNILVKNPNCISSGVAKMTINGTTMDDKIIHIHDYSGICNVEIELG